jgi:tetratricopeptide (TPR) repeat protein
VRIVAIAVAIAASGFIGVQAAGSLAAPPPCCASADALRSVGRSTEAVQQYVALLKTQPHLACALDGLRALATDTAAQGKATTTAKCHAADELVDAGERDAAKALYIEALKAGNPCGRAGLDALKNKRWVDRWKDRLSDITSILALLATPLVVALLLATLLYALMTYIGPVRRRLRVLRILGHPLQPRLEVGKFDEPSNWSMGGSVHGLLRSSLSKLGRDQARNRDDYRLDSATGAEGVDTAVASLADIAPQFKAVAAVLTFGRQIARSPHYQLDGTIQAPRAEVCGLTVSLGRARGSSSTSTLWDSESATKAEEPSRMYYLAAVAAGWADFRLREREQLEVAEGFNSAECYGHFRAGFELEREQDQAGAWDAYRNALLHDRRSVPTLLNLARLAGRMHDYAEARRLLDRAILILDHELDA